MQYLLVLVFDVYVVGCEPIILFLSSLKLQEVLSLFNLLYLLIMKKTGDVSDFF